MGLVTRCPTCGTGFRVGADQLKALHGTVRCGRCDAVFNAFDSLVTLADSAEGAVPERPRVAQEVPAPRAVVEEIPGPEAAPEPVELLSFGGAPRAPAEEFALVSPPADAAPSLPAGETPREDTAPAAPHPGQGELALGYAEAVRPRRSGAWGYGALALALVFALQLAYVLRAEIAGMLPPLRPWLEQACAALGCSLPLPRRVEQWNIESSDLQADPVQPSLMTLTAALRNRAAVAQEYPALELTLTDTQDQALARRVFAAPDYLLPGTDLRPGLAANGEVVVRLTMDTGDLNAAGYRLFLFYP